MEFLIGLSVTFVLITFFAVMLDRFILKGCFTKGDKGKKSNSAYLSLITDDNDYVDYSKTMDERNNKNINAFKPKGQVN